MPDSIDAMRLGGDLPAQEPGIDRPVEHLAWQLRWQALACAHMGSSLYGHLCERAAADVEERGPCWRVLRHHVRPGRGDALALRFLAAVHRLVLTGQAPDVAPHYPSVGGAGSPSAAWPAFRATVEASADGLAVDVATPCQTNEVGRAAALACAFLEVGRDAPVRLREVGASAGLNLRWDHFRYGSPDVTWGRADSPVDLRGHWEHPPPVRSDVRVEERLGCDLHPIDPESESGRLALTSSVWADQVERLARLEGALAIAREVPASVERADAADWLAHVLDPAPGIVTVVYQSVVEEYLSEGVRARVRAIVEHAGSAATSDSPLAWVRLEPLTALRSHGVTLTTWPGGAQRLIATCGPHGNMVRYRA